MAGAETEGSFCIWAQQMEQQHLPQGVCPPPDSKGVSAAATPSPGLGWDSLGTQLRVLSCFSSSHTDPKGPQAPWGCKSHTSTPSPHCTLGNGITTPLSTSCAACTQQNSSSRGTEGWHGANQEMPQCPLRCCFSCTTSEPWDAQGCW